MPAFAAGIDAFDDAPGDDTRNDDRRHPIWVRTGRIFTQAIQE